jgi:hypothetical protein
VFKADQCLSYNDFSKCCKRLGAPDVREMMKEFSIVLETIADPSLSGLLLELSGLSLELLIILDVRDRVVIGYGDGDVTSLQSPLATLLIFKSSNHCALLSPPYFSWSQVDLQPFACCVIESAA